jgi:diketogulonate reductase-like aldo/keto reductase
VGYRSINLIAEGGVRPIGAK